MIRNKKTGEKQLKTYKLLQEDPTVNNYSQHIDNDQQWTC